MFFKLGLVKWKQNEIPRHLATAEGTLLSSNHEARGLFVLKCTSKLQPGVKMAVNISH